jgi:hypothetical protein
LFASVSGTRCVHGTLLAVTVAIACALQPFRPAVAATAVCVIAPLLEEDGREPSQARVPIGRPTIFSTDSLEEVRIERNGTRLWERQAGPDGPIEGPIRWPLPPIRAGETLLLLLRPRGAGENDFAMISLQGDPVARMATANAELDGLGSDPSAWWQAVQRAIDRNDLPLAIAYLFAFEGPSSPQLDHLRRDVFLAGCGP